MARGATVGAYDGLDADASGGARAPRWGFRLLGVSVVALTGVVGAISLDLYRQTHPGAPLFDLSRIVGAVGLPESFVDRGLHQEPPGGTGASTLITLSIAQAPPATPAPAAASAPAPASLSAPAPVATPASARPPADAPAPVAAAVAPPPAAPAPEPVVAAAAAVEAPQPPPAPAPLAPAPMAQPAVAAPAAPAAEAPASIGVLATVAPDPEPAPEPLATRAALTAVADLRRPVLPSATVAPAEPENQPTDLPDPLAVRHSLTVAAAVPPATVEMLKPVVTVTATSLGAVSPVRATAYLDEPAPAAAAAAAAPAAVAPAAPAPAESSGGFEIGELPSIFAGLSSISAQAAESPDMLDAMVPPPAPADLIMPADLAAAAPGGTNPAAASRPPARGIIFAVEATRLADVVTHGADRHDPVASVVANASLTAVPMDEDAAAAVPTVPGAYIVTPAASLLRPPVDPADVTDVDSRGRGLSACEEGDDACRAFVAAEDGALSLPSPVLARYGRNPVVLGGTELSSDPAELERELRCLSFIAYGEAGNQGPRGMAAVIWVIMNRVAAGDVFASGPCEVIAQDGQFEPMTLGRYDDIAATIKAGEMPPFLNSRGAERILQRTARLVVWQMMDGYFADDPTVGAQYFLAPAAMRALGRSLPSWTNRFTMTAAIGDHNFYRRDGL